MSTESRWESVGWGFFGIMLVLFLGPCIYLVLSMTYDTLHIGTRVGTGVFLAFFAAGMVSWMVNSLLQYRSARVHAKRDTKGSGGGRKR